MKRLTKDGTIKAVGIIEICYLPVSSHSAKILTYVFPSQEDFDNGVISEAETDLVGPGTGVELFDTAANPEDVAFGIIKALPKNQGWTEE